MKKPWWMTFFMATFAVIDFVTAAAWAPNTPPLVLLMAGAGGVMVAAILAEWGRWYARQEASQ